jgi:hypothetical protein
MGIKNITVHAARSLPDPLNPQHTMGFSLTLSKDLGEKANYRIESFDLMGEANHLIDCYVESAGAEVRQNTLRELRKEIKK